MHEAIDRLSKAMGRTFLTLALAGAGCVCGARAQDASNQDLGRSIYMEARCYACHGEYGYGGVGPRFRQDHFLGLTDYVVGQLLIGRGAMPSFAQTLNDKQIADVATYIRTSWGNSFGDVSPQEVAQVRDQVKEKPPKARTSAIPNSRLACLRRRRRPKAPANRCRRPASNSARRAYPCFFEAIL